MSIRQTKRFFVSLIVYCRFLNWSRMMMTIFSTAFYRFIQLTQGNTTASPYRSTNFSMLTTHNKLTKRSGISLSFVCWHKTHKQTKQRQMQCSLTRTHTNILYCIVFYYRWIVLPRALKKKRRDDRRLQRMKEKAEKEFIWTLDSAIISAILIYSCINVFVKLYSSVAAFAVVGR